MKKSKRTRLALVGALALALSATVGLTASDVASAAKKKTKAGGTVDITKQVNQGIPDAASNTSWGKLTSTIQVGGKKFKGTRVRDVNVTLQTTGAAANSASDVIFTLTSPNGTNDWFFGFAGNGQNIGPLTLDDESVNAIQAAFGGGSAVPPARDPTQLASPFVGTAQPFCFQAFGACPLAVLDNGPASGTWTLTAFDGGPGGGNTSVLNLWRLVVQTGKAYRTK
jgi:subtilisin-like proprotein convertase family protein